MTTRSPDRNCVALAGLLSLTLAACVSRPVTESALALPPDWPTRRELLQQQRDFSLRGRVAVAAGEQGFSASLRWTQQGEQTQIWLDGPFGLGALAIETDGAALLVTDARGQRFDGEAARVELERQLGFAVPLASLRYWVQGLPSPVAPADEALENGRPRLARLEQLGWTVEYREYQPAPAAHRPRRLVASYAGARVRLLIERWLP